MERRKNKRLRLHTQWIVFCPSLTLGCYCNHSYTGIEINLIFLLGAGVGVQSSHDSVGHSQDERVSRGTIFSSCCTRFWWILSVPAVKAFYFPKESLEEDQSLFFFLYLRPLPCMIWSLRYINVSLLHNHRLKISLIVIISVGLL